MNGPEDEDPPEPEDHARDRGQQVDERRRPGAGSGGASSVRKIEIAIESGVAKRSATERGH